MPDFITSVWTPVSLLAAIAAGFLLGFVVLGRFDDNSKSLMAGLIGWVGFVVLLSSVFYAGQAVDTYLSSGLELAERVISRALLFDLYGLFVGLGAIAYVVVNQTRPKGPPKD